MAMVGVMNVKVPPCTMGSLTPNVACSRVATPEQKKIVLISLESARPLFAIHRKGDSTKGIEMHAPIMVR